MRVKKITVKQLFGLFDYSIPLNTQERITIIHALNGKGKTTILRLLDDLLSGRLSKIKSVPFKEFCLDFDDGTGILIIKTGRSKSNRYGLKIYQIDINGKQKEIQRDDSFLDTFPSRFWEEEIPFLRRIDKNIWLDRRNGSTLHLEEVIDRYGHLLSIYRDNDKPDWLKKFRETFHVHFISANRLLQIDNDFEELSAIRYSFGNKESSMMPSVRLYAEELKSAIESNLAKSAALSQELDRTFPSRLIKKQKEKIPKKFILSDEEIHEKLKDLEARRDRLKGVGLLDSGEASPVQTEESMDEHTRRVLSLYIKDTLEKLRVFDELEKKINLLKEIINKRFQNKEIIIERDRGFSFINPEGRHLSPEVLSSGEQHELVLNYELLFRSKPGSLILIDEPEISLHITWQKEFLEDLSRIAQLNEIDILIATHSPDIINGRWDLTYPLEGIIE